MSESVAPSRFGRVAVLMGGNSSEREVSLHSGHAVLKALQDSGVDAFGVDYVEQSLEILGQEKVDRVFIILHGGMGEDGSVQGALDLLGIPYTGSGVLASALSMDKVRAKKIWHYDGLSTPAWQELDDRTDFQAVIDSLGTVFVKPVCDGSSIGISKAVTAKELADSFATARQFDARVIAESWIEGREFSVPIVGNEVLPVIELQTEKEFYDYEAKYLSDKTQYICPAALSAEKTTEIQALSLAAYESLNCNGWGRVDVMQDEHGRFWLLEINTIPGMTSHSLLPMGARQAGYTFESIVLKILATTLNEGEH